MFFSIESKMFEGVKMLQQITITLILRWFYFLQHIGFAKSYWEIGGKLLSKEEFQVSRFVICIFVPLHIYVRATLFSELCC